MPEPMASGDIALDIGSFRMIYSDGELNLQVRYEAISSADYQEAMYLLTAIRRQMEKKFERLESAALESSELLFAVAPESAQSAWSAVLRIICAEGADQ